MIGNMAEIWISAHRIRRDGLHGLEYSGIPSQSRVSSCSWSSRSSLIPSSVEENKVRFRRALREGWSHADHSTNQIGESKNQSILTQHDWSCMNSGTNQNATKVQTELSETNQKLITIKCRCQYASEYEQITSKMLLDSAEDQIC